MSAAADEPADEPADEALAPATPTVPAAPAEPPPAEPAPGSPTSPARTAVLVTVAYALAMAAWLLLPWTAGTHSAGGWVVLVGVGVTRVLVAVVLLRVLGLTKASGLGARPAPGTLRFAVPLLLLPALPLVLGPGLADAAPWRFAVAGLLTATVAFGEETVFRGVVLRVLLRRGVRSAVLGSAACFGAMHAVNLLAGDHPVTVGAQVLMTAGLGVALAAVTLASGSLGPALAVHLLLDLANAVQAAAPRVPALLAATTSPAAPTGPLAHALHAVASPGAADLWAAAAVNVALGALAAAYGLVLVRRGAGRIAALRAEHGR